MSYYLEWTWRNAKDDPMCVEILHHGAVMFRFFIGEAMEGAGRERVMRHVRECDHSPWLKEWHRLAQEEMLDNLSKER
jgi:hypothetical protein